MALKQTLSLAKTHLHPLKTILKASLCFQSGQILEAISDTTFERGKLPEPFDFPSHIGNTREAAMATVGAYARIVILTLTIPLVDRSRELFQRRAKSTALAAFAVSAAMQVAGEKYGLTNSFISNTPDALDAAYGIGWSAVTALGVHHLVISTEQHHHELNQASQPEA